MKRIELTYHEGPDEMLYPDLTIPEQTHYSIGKYGSLHRAFLKAHRPGTYSTLVMEFRLNEHLHGIDEQAKEMVGTITARLAAEQGINEAMKSRDQLRWVQEMNNCKAAAEEIVMKELICV